MQNNSFLRRFVIPKSHQNKNDKDEKKDENNDSTAAVNGAPSLLVADFELVNLQVNQSVSFERTKIGTNLQIQRLFLENEGFRNITSLPLQATTLGTLSLQGMEDAEGQPGLVGTQDVLPLNDERLLLEGGNYFFSSPSLSEELNIEFIEGTAGSVPSIQADIKTADFHLFGIVVSTIVAGVVVIRVLASPSVLPTIKSLGIKLITEVKPLIQNSVRFLGVLLEPKSVVVFG